MLACCDGRARGDVRVSMGINDEGGEEGRAFPRIDQMAADPAARVWIATVLSAYCPMSFLGLITSSQFLTMSWRLGSSL